jgi:Uma2 family endonuclease
MSKPYEERLNGETCLRPPPAPRHEEICRRLHERISATLTTNRVVQLLAPRSKVALSYDTDVCPDLSILTTANQRLFLVAEVVGSEDHRWDTVTKKSIYEEMRIPRLWMVDPRYNNVEVYHCGEHGLVLKQILAVRDLLSDPLLPGFQYDMSELFKV